MASFNNPKLTGPDVIPRKEASLFGAFRLWIAYWRPSAARLPFVLVLVPLMVLRWSSLKTLGGPTGVACFGGVLLFWGWRYAIKESDDRYASVSGPGIGVAIRVGKDHRLGSAFEPYERFWLTGTEVVGVSDEPTSPFEPGGFLFLTWRDRIVGIESGVGIVWPARMVY